MPTIEREIENEKVVAFDIDVLTFMDACSNEELDEVYDFLDESGRIENEIEEVEVEVGFDFPNDGSLSDSNLNSTLFKISDARLQLTNEDLEDLNRIAKKYR